MPEHEHEPKRRRYLSKRMHRQCHYCGRRGVQGFFSTGLNSWKCVAQRACSKRRESWNRGFLSRG